MTLDPQLAITEEEEGPMAPAHHPPAPHDELFDVSTTVDPSYVISLIRKLLPAKITSSHNSDGVDASDAMTRDRALSSCGNEALNSPNNNAEPTDALNGFNDHQEKRSEGSCHIAEHSNALLGEQAWEECGCVLWDLSASRTHAEFMVQNFILEVLLANLMVSESARIKEISLGIIGNLACHEAPMKHIVSTNGLIAIILDQMFIDDTPCLCEICRLLTLGLQGSEGVTWAEAVKSEHILSRLLWVAENTLNPHLIERSVGLLLAIVESELEVASGALATLMKLGFMALLINLLSSEMSKLLNEKMPERYCLLDLILRAIEALSTDDDYSQELCLNKELFKMAYDLVRLPDKAEIANSCVTAVVLLANILGDATDLASNLSHDLDFLQGLLNILPFASDDLDAQSAIWNIMARLLVRVDERKMSPSSLHQYVSVLSANSELIEDDLLNQQLDNSNEEHENSTTPGTNSDARDIALRRIINILNQWISSKDDGLATGNDHVDEGSVTRLLHRCRKHIK